jgi:hypothetical protein
MICAKKFRACLPAGRQQKRNSGTKAKYKNYFFNFLLMKRLARAEFVYP